MSKAFQPRGVAPSIWDITDPGETFPHLTSDRKADLAIIGGGIFGLTTALAAVEAGLSVAVVEQTRLAAGASGRTSGFVAPALRPLPRGRELGEALGEERAGRFRALVTESGRAVFDLVDRHDLAVPAARAGWIEAAHTPVSFARLAAETGPDDRVLDARAIAAVTGIEGWHGGVIHADGGAIDPKAFVRELARVATSAGVAVFEQTRAVALRPAVDRRVEVVCGSASIEAAHAVDATNGMSGLVPEITAGVMPVTVHQAVTDVLPVELRQAILPGGHTVTDTRRHSIAARWTPDGRLLTGGLLRPALRPAVAEATAYFGARLRRTVGPATLRAGQPLSVLAPRFVWHGRIAVTGTGLPLLYAPTPAVIGVVACNGRGIALGTALGAVLGAAIANARGGPVDYDRIPLPLGRPQPRPLRYVAGFGARIQAAIADTLDGRDVKAFGPPDTQGDSL